MNIPHPHGKTIAQVPPFVFQSRQENSNSALTQFLKTAFLNSGSPGINGKGTRKFEGVGGYTSPNTFKFSTISRQERESLNSKNAYQGTLFSSAWPYRKLRKGVAFENFACYCLLMKWKKCVFSLCSHLMTGVKANVSIHNRP